MEQTKQNENGRVSHHFTPPLYHLMIKGNEANVSKIIRYQTCVYHTQYKYQSCHNHNISLYTVSVFLPFQFVLQPPYSLCFIINNRLLLNSIPFNWSICSGWLSGSEELQNMPMWCEGKSSQTIRVNSSIKSSWD